MSAPPSPALAGIFPVIPTLFDDAGSVDGDAMRRVVRFALDGGAHGVVYPGVASEYASLSWSERVDLTALVSEEVAARVPIIAGASAATTDEVIAAGKLAMDHGIARVMILAPATLGAEVGAHQERLAAVAAELAGIEIMLQNAPPPVGAGLIPAALTELVSASGAVTYAKEETLPSGPAITALRSAGISHLKGVFGGGGSRYLIDELCRGAIGALPAVELIELHVAIYRAHRAGQFARARELYRLSLPLLTAQAVYRTRFTKYVLKRRSIVDRQHVRAAHPQLDEEGRRDIDAMLDDLQAAFPLSDSQRKLSR